jgi:cell division septation protein DedD
LSTSAGPQIDVSLHSIFASRKRSPAEEEKQVATMLPSNFQVYAKIEEEYRRDSNLSVSFLLTLNDARGSVTYEFRGVCGMVGSSADFESIMGASKESRVPKILDIIYQRLYPVVFMLASMTTSSYPQSVALLTEMVSSEPIQVHQEAEALPKPEEKPKIAEKPAAAAKPMPAPADAPKVAEAPKPTIAKMKKPQASAGEADKPMPAKV